MKKLDLENAFAQSHWSYCNNCARCEHIVRTFISSILYDEE